MSFQLNFSCDIGAFFEANVQKQILKVVPILIGRISLIKMFFENESYFRIFQFVFDFLYSSALIVGLQPNKES